MGYYPPYVPDLYLQTVKITPAAKNRVGRVEPVTSVKRKWVQHQSNPSHEHALCLKRMAGKGLRFDRYA